jgi:hypothetical protein
MDFHDVRDHLDEEFEFPVDHAPLVEEVGGMELDAPAAESETVRTVLNRTDKRAYRSAGEVHEILLGTVSDAYIGRKYYDDRSGSRPSSQNRSVLSF